MINTTTDRIIARTQLLTLADMMMYINSQNPTVEGVKAYIEAKRELLNQELEELKYETDSD